MFLHDRYLLKFLSFKLEKFIIFSHFTPSVIFVLLQDHTISVRRFLQYYKWPCSAPGSLWETPDTILGPQPKKSNVLYHRATTSPLKFILAILIAAWCLVALYTTVGCCMVASLEKEIRQEEDATLHCIRMSFLVCCLSVLHNNPQLPQLNIWVTSPHLHKRVLTAFSPIGN